MSAAWTENVKPASARQETLSVAVACLLIILVAGLLISVRGRVEATQELAEYQISAYDGLNPTEQGIYNDLLAASLDIDLYHADTLRWPSVLQLQGQYIAPFVKDLSWQQRGALEWQQDIPNIELQHTVAYYALSKKPDVTGSFLLWMTHKHNMSGPMADAFMAQRGGQGKAITQGPGMVPGALPTDPLAAGISGDMGVAGLPSPGNAPTEPKPGAAATQAFKPQVRVWVHPGSAEPPTVYQDEQLIQAGWKEVIARTGTEETQRLQGGAQ
jgi:hypothetical protein